MWAPRSVTGGAAELAGEGALDRVALLGCQAAGVEGTAQGKEYELALLVRDRLDAAVEVESRDRLGALQRERHRALEDLDLGPELLGADHRLVPQRRQGVDPLLEAVAPLHGHRDRLEELLVDAGEVEGLGRVEIRCDVRLCLLQREAPHGGRTHLGSLASVRGADPATGDRWLAARLAAAVRGGAPPPEGEVSRAHQRPPGRERRG